VVTILRQEIAVLAPNLRVQLGLVCNSCLDEKYKKITEVMDVDIVPFLQDLPSASPTSGAFGV